LYERDRLVIDFRFDLECYDL